MKSKKIACLIWAIFSSVNLVRAQAPDPKGVTYAGAKLSVDDCFRNALEFENKQNYKEAENFYNMVISNIEKEKTKNLPALFKAYSGLGNVELKLQDLVGADLSYREALSTAVKLYGSGSFDLIKPLANIARVCYQEKKFLDAATYLKQALALAERKFSVEDSEAVTLREKLAETYERSGNYKDSEILIRQSLALREKMGDHSSPQLLALLNCYSDVLHKTERNAEAEQVDYQVDQIHAGKVPPPLPAGLTSTLKP